MTQVHVRFRKPSSVRGSDVLREALKKNFKCCKHWLSCDIWGRKVSKSTIRRHLQAVQTGCFVKGCRKELHYWDQPTCSQASGLKLMVRWDQNGTFWPCTPSGMFGVKRVMHKRRKQSPSKPYVKISSARQSLMLWRKAVNAASGSGMLLVEERWHFNECFGGRDQWHFQSHNLVASARKLETWP